MRHSAPSVARPPGVGAGLLSSDARLPAAPRVVLVDDDERLRASIRELLEDEGCTVVGEAGSGAEALGLVPVAGAVLPKGTRAEQIVATIRQAWTQVLAGR